MVWLCFYEIKEERDSLFVSVLKKFFLLCMLQIMVVLLEINEGYFIIDMLLEYLIFEIRIMKLEMILFCCNKLIEILIDRLRVLIFDFLLIFDLEVVVYVDDDLEWEIGL